MMIIDLNKIFGRHWPPATERDYMKIMTLLLVEQSSNRLAIARLILAQGYDLFPHPQITSHIALLV
jgi:hypothetical protein